MPNPQILFAAQVVAILSTLLLAVGYLKADPRAMSARVFAIMAVFVVFYLLLGMSGANINPSLRLELEGWNLLLTTGTSAICGLFMVYCFLIFQEQQKFPLVLSVAFGCQVILDFALQFLQDVNSAAGDAFVTDLLLTAMDVLQLVFVGFAIYWTLKGWRADLVEDRRVFRWFIISVQGALIFIVVFVESFMLDGGSPANAQAQALIVYAIAFLVLAMVLSAMKFDYVSLSSVIRRVTELSDKSEEEGNKEFDIDAFNREFRDKQMYREAGLTIAMLASKLGMPEYKLRAFIHKELGFRNFNAMLHKYRIEDASKALADPGNVSVPVLTIALSVGYQSITPFNNAFRELIGVTPSEYRKSRKQSG